MNVPCINDMQKRHCPALGIGVAYDWLEMAAGWLTLFLLLSQNVANISQGFCFNLFSFLAFVNSINA